MSFTALKFAGVVRPTSLAVQIIFLYTGRVVLAFLSIQHEFLSLHHQFSGKLATLCLSLSAASRLSILFAVVHGNGALTHIALQSVI